MLEASRFRFTLARTRLELGSGMGIFNDKRWGYFYLTKRSTALNWQHSTHRKHMLLLSNEKSTGPCGGGAT